MKRHLFSLSMVLVLALVVSCQPAPSIAVPTAPTIAPTTPPPAEPIAPPTVEPTEAAETAVSVEPTFQLFNLDGVRKMTLEELKQLPTVEGWAGIKSNTGKITPPARFKGVTLVELFQPVGGLRADFGIKVVAKNGYALMFSYDQVTKGDFITYDPATGDEVKADEPLQLVMAYEQDGQPILADTGGPFRIVVLTPKNNQVVDEQWVVQGVTRIEIKPMVEERTISNGNCGCGQQ